MAKDRISQVNELLKQELGAIVLREAEVPEGAVVTVTRVDCSPNLQQAKVYVSVVPDKYAKDVIKGLQRNIYDIQQTLNERLSMRPVPRVQWVIEEATAQAARIEDLLDQIKKAE